MLTLVYIAGFNYSGSTLLAFLLNAHPDVSTTGEIAGPARFVKNDEHWSYMCSCGREMQHCCFWQELEKRIDCPDFHLASHKWGTRLLSIPPRLTERIAYGSFRNTQLEEWRDFCRHVLPGLRSTARRKIDLNSRFIHAAASILSSSILVDSSKNPMHLSLLARIPTVQIRAIHLVRHPGGCVLSALNHSPHSLPSAAAAWRANFITTTRQLHRLPDIEWVRVRYEDLCANPQGFLEHLCQFLGIQFAPTMLHFREAEHHIYGNPMRLSDTRDIRLDQRWHTELSSDDLAEIQRDTRHQAAACGYTFPALESPSRVGEES